MKYEKLSLKWSNIMKIAGKQLLDINPEIIVALIIIITAAFSANRYKGQWMFSDYNLESILNLPLQAKL